jgi:hypothetical protein
MNIVVKCLVNEFVQLVGQLNYSRGKQVSVEPIVFNKIGQQHLFKNIDEFAPYKVGAEGVARFGKISIEFLKPDNNKKIETKELDTKKIEIKTVELSVKKERKSKKSTTEAKSEDSKTI